MNLEELLQKRAEITAKLRGILDLADSEGRAITEDEETTYDALEIELQGVEDDIKKAEIEAARRERLEVRENDINQIRNQPPQFAATYRAENPREFSNIGEFMCAVRFNPHDPRLQDSWESFRNEQSMGVGAEGGFAVPSQFRDTLLAVSPQQAIFRPRAQVIPAGSPPDAKLEIPALDQGSAQNVYGGVVVDWIAEGATKPETDVKIRDIELQPWEVAGYIKVTDKLLRNWASASSLLSNQLRLAIIGAEETKFYSGNGVGCPLGVLNSPARIEYARATANQIAFADVIGMFARLKMGGSPVWIASQTTIPQLATIQDAAGNYIYVQSATADVPASLFGYPVLFSERSVGLGTTGDLVLVNLDYYLIKDGSGPFVATSEHFLFTQNKTVMKAFWNVDGQPWLNEPLPLEGSTSNTVSPFIVLK